MKIAIYPGSFDPVTLGHLDIIRRASIMFDRLIVAVMHNQNKKPAFTAEERVEFLKRTTADLPNVEVESFGGSAGGLRQAEKRMRHRKGSACGFGF